MQIVDTKFGAEIVTKKGKVYKFDATECMLKALSLDNIQINDAEKFYVIDAANPKQLTGAVTAFYLISTNFPSPMGADLSAFRQESDLESFQNQYGGEVKNWNELLAKFKIQ
ncbi:MAG: nitrous oxide reductase accessory protein NosL [Chlorobi bacterium]|nr:nitrous oxide reductase accessory protein NosL [Chlorobiota bacterium]MCI0716417.1 nitrous oxide reductase accessory protein NosL [Chlorobiota bacterium]